MKGIKINIPTSRKIVSFFFNYRVGFIVAFIVTISVYWLINNQERKEITLYADTFMLKDPYVEIDIFLNKKGEKVYLRDTSNIYIIPRYKDLIRFHVSGVPLHTQDNIFNIGQYIKHADTTTYDGEMPLDKRLWHSKVISDEYIKCDMFITGDWFLAPRFSDGLIRGITPDTMYSEYSVGIKNYSDDIKKTDVLIEDYNSNSDYNLIGENELYDEYFESRVEEKVYYNIQENGYCSDIILPERGYRSLNVKLKPKTAHHISKDIYYIGNFFSTFSGDIFANISIRNNFFDKIKTVSIQSNDPLLIRSLYPEPDEITSESIIYNSKEKLEQLFYPGLTFYVESSWQRSFAEKINFILATLIGAFSSIITEIGLFYFTNREKKGDKKPVKWSDGNSKMRKRYKGRVKHY